MPVTREAILTAISDIPLPQGGTLGAADIVRAISIDAGTVRFVLEVENAATAKAYEPVEAEAKARVAALPEVTAVQIVMTAPAKPAPPKAVSGDAPSLKIGGIPSRRRDPRPFPAFATSSPSVRARAASANRPSRRTLPWPWPAQVARWACWMPTSMVRRSRG